MCNRGGAKERKYDTRTGFRKSLISVETVVTPNKTVVTFIVTNPCQTIGTNLWVNPITINE